MDFTKKRPITTEEAIRLSKVFDKCLSSDNEVAS